GDGTLNEIVNGVTEPNGTVLATTGAVLTGRGRDACRNFDLAADWRRAARRLVEGADAAFDLGAAEWADGTRRFFLSAAGAGFDAAVARRVASRGGRGTLPYLVGIVEGLIAHRPIPATLAVDGGPEQSAPLTTVIVANGAWYGGGGKRPPPPGPGGGGPRPRVLWGPRRGAVLRGGAAGLCRPPHAASPAA